MDLHRKTADPVLRASFSGQIRQAKHGSIASANELKEFLRTVKGRSPDQLLGVVAQSELFLATITATVGTVILMAILTVGPYLMGVEPVTAHPVQAKAAAPEAAPAATNPTPAAVAAPTDPAAKPAVTNPGDKPPLSTKDEAVKKLGVGEVKNADPKSNPLDGKGDDLLKGVDK